MDPDIEEIKAQVAKILLITEDTNRAVHNIRRAGWWGLFFQILWWGAILGSSAYAYHYYVQPYMANLQALYSQVQSSGQQAQGLEQTVIDYVRTHFAQPMPAASQVQQASTSGQ
jgi:hypothetical protein